MAIITNAVIEKRHNSKNLGYLWSGIDSKLNIAIDNFNLLNDNLLSVLDNSTSVCVEATKNLSYALNYLGDFSVLSGNSNSSFGPLSLNVVSNTNVNIFKLNNQIFLLDKNIRKPIYKNVTIGGSVSVGDTSNPGYIKNNVLGSLPYGSRVDFESYDVPLSAYIDLFLAEDFLVNGISFSFANNGVRYPVVSISGVKNSGDIISIATEVDTEITNGLVNLRFDAVNIERISIGVSQLYGEKVLGRNRYSFGISAFDAGLFSSVESGEIVFGPYISENEIFKASIDSNIDTNKNFEISLSDDGKTWYGVSSASSDSDLPKILNFNDIDESSVKTTYPVKTLYVKASLKSTEKIYNKPNQNIYSIETYQYDSFTRSVFLNQDLELTSVYETDGTFIGGKGNATNTNTRYAEAISIGGEFVPRNSESILVDSIVYSNYGYPFINVSDAFEVHPSADIMMETAKISTFTNPKIVEQNITRSIISDTSKYVIHVKDDLDFGVYTLHIDEDVYEIDLSSGFSINTSAAIFSCLEGSVSYVMDPAGAKINLYPSQIREEFFINLNDVIFKKNNSVGYNELFPLKKMEANEWIILNGNIIAGRVFRDTASVSQIKLKNSNFSVKESVDGNILVLSDGKKTKVKHRLNKFDFKKIAKLKHSNIINSTVSFDFSDASVNNMLIEVPYIDGKSEFTVSNKERSTSNRSKNRIKISPYLIDNDSLAVLGGSSVIKNRVYSEFELVDLGDYFIYKSEEEDAGHPYYEIRLPNNIFTPDIIDSIIEYDVNSINKSSAGIYSVDYKRGILYSSSPIDGNTSIEYQYSNILISGTSGRLLKEDQYKETKTTLTLNGNIEESTIGIVYKDKGEEDIKYMSSAKLKNITINILDSKSL